MANPNNCSGCDYMTANDDPALHCYMFKDAPQDICHQHTARKNLAFDLLMAVAKCHQMGNKAKENGNG